MLLFSFFEIALLWLLPFFAVLLPFVPVFFVEFERLFDVRRTVGIFLVRGYRFQSRRRDRAAAFRFVDQHVHRGF